MGGSLCFVCPMQSASIYVITSAFFIKFEFDKFVIFLSILTTACVITSFSGQSISSFEGSNGTSRCSRNSIISWPAYKSLPHDPCKHNSKYSLEDLGIQLLDLKHNNQLNKVFYYLLWSSNLDFDRWYYSQDFSFSIQKPQSYCFKYPNSGETHIMFSVSIFEPCCNYSGLNVLFRQSNIFVKEILPDFLIVSDTGLSIEGFTGPT